MLDVRVRGTTVLSARISPIWFSIRFHFRFVDWQTKTIRKRAGVSYLLEFGKHKKQTSNKMKNIKKNEMKLLQKQTKNINKWHTKINITD